MTIYGKTDTGRVRKTNQDAFLHEHIGRFDLLVVCDGMGGVNGGETASATAAQTFAEAVRTRLQYDEDAEKAAVFLEEALREANTAVYQRSKLDTSLAGMGTTLVAVLTDEDVLCAVHVGDSRLYFLTKDNITQITHDHSYVQALVDNGSITKDESRNHPNKNIITRAVGTEAEVEGDVFVMKYNCDGAYLLCTDGLTGMVNDEEILCVYKKSPSVKETVETLVSRANDAGGNDNITALMLCAK